MTIYMRVYRIWTCLGRSCAIVFIQFPGVTRGAPHPLDRYHGARHRQERLQGTPSVGPAVARGESSDSRRGSSRTPRRLPPMWSLPMLSDTYSM